MLNSVSRDLSRGRRELFRQCRRRDAKTILAQMNLFARIVQCGVISVYDTEGVELRALIGAAPPQYLERASVVAV